MIALLSSKAATPTQSSSPSASNTSLSTDNRQESLLTGTSFAVSPSFLTGFGPLALSQRLTVFMMRWWYPGTLTWCSPKKAGTLAGIGQCYHGVKFQALVLTRALNGELTSRIPPPQYMAVKTFYIDMSSRFTAPHCLSYYQAINSRAGMNWLTLRVVGVASCNLIPYIILSVSLGFFLFSSHGCVLLNKCCIYLICRWKIIKIKCWSSVSRRLFVLKL